MNDSSERDASWRADAAGSTATDALGLRGWVITPSADTIGADGKSYSSNYTAGVTRLARDAHAVGCLPVPGVTGVFDKGCGIARTNLGALAPRRAR